MHLFVVLHHSKKVAAEIAGPDVILLQNSSSFPIDFIGSRASLHFTGV